MAEQHYALYGHEKHCTVQSLLPAAPRRILDIHSIIAAKLPFLRKSDSLFFLILCSGTALLNAIGHSFINFPIDRYFFWGYPLLLICWLILLVELFTLLTRQWDGSKLVNALRDQASL
jgi:hypothetical protein